MKIKIMMNMKFPVITFDREENIYFVRNEDDLVICNGSALNNGFYNNLLIIDITGTQYVVESIDIEKVVGYNIFLQKKIKVNLNFKKDISLISLEDFKTKILESYKKYIAFWEAGGNVQENIMFIQNSESIGEIINNLCDEFYEER